MAKQEFKKEDTEGRKQYLARYVAPHKKISRPVLESDMKRVVEEAHILYNLCYTERGLYLTGLAVAHSQIDDKDPLRLFVTKDKKIVINPVITRHTNHPLDRTEACLTFPNERPIIVQRWNKVTVSYNVMNNDGSIGDIVTEDLIKLESQMFQHEMDHLDGKYIFNN